MPRAPFFNRLASRFKHERRHTGQGAMPEIKGPVRQLEVSGPRIDQGVMPGEREDIAASFSDRHSIPSLENMNQFVSDCLIREIAGIEPDLRFTNDRPSRSPARDTNPYDRFIQFGEIAKNIGDHSKDTKTGRMSGQCPARAIRKRGNLLPLRLGPKRELALFVL